MIAASGESGGIYLAANWGSEHYADGEPCEEEKSAHGGVACSLTDQQVHGSESQPGHIDNGTEGKEHAK